MDPRGTTSRNAALAGVGDTSVPRRGSITEFARSALSVRAPTPPAAGGDRREQPLEDREPGLSARHPCENVLVQRQILSGELRGNGKW